MLRESEFLNIKGTYVTFYDPWGQTSYDEKNVLSFMQNFDNIKF